MNNLLSFSSVMGSIGSVIIAILILLATITVHEFGHYAVGKLLKFKINEFSIGMGPAIFKKVKKNGEIFSIRLLPLGGYCAFEGEDEDVPSAADNDSKNTPEPFTDAEKSADSAVNGDSSEPAQQKQASPDSFNNKKPWQRILVQIAGASVNFIVAVLIIALNFSIFGHFAYKVNDVAPITSTDVAAEGYSLRDNDVIVELNGRFLYLTTDFTDALAGGKRGDIVKVGVIRDGKKQTVEVALRSDIKTENMGDVASSYLALGIGCVPYMTDDLNSKLPAGVGILAVDNGNGYETSTRIYSLRQFGDVIASRSFGEEVGIYVTSDDPADNGKKLVKIVLDGDFAEKQAAYMEEVGTSPDSAYKHIVRDYFNIEYYSPAFTMESANVRLGFGEILYRPIVYAFKTVGTTFRAFGQLFNGKLKITALSGPVSTISMTSEYVQYGLNYVLEIAAFIGISVAVFNLLPIPALDGARAVFVAIEWVRGKPINRKVEGMIHAVGLVALLIFAVLVDVLKLFI